jgi:hypothetical protein
MMGITSNDIAAQRAMLERGEEKRKADWKQAERERLRDTFAAAALTVLLVNGPFNTDALPRLAYSMADAMLRERERTNHDAAPEAIASPSESSVPLGNGAAPANTQTVPPCVETYGPPSKGEGLSEAEIDALEYVVEEGRIASMDDYGILRSLLVRVRPEWESQSYEESDEKRMNTTMNRDTTPGDGSVQGEGTLTDAEREVLKHEVELAEYQQRHDLVATLRGLLERTPATHATPAQGSVRGQ